MEIFRYPHHPPSWLFPDPSNVQADIFCPCPPPPPLLLKAKLPLKAFWGLLTLPGSSLGEVFSRWCTMGFGNSHFAPPLVKVQMLTLKMWSLQSLSSGQLQSNAHLQTFLEEPRAPDYTPSSFRGLEPTSSKNAFYQVLLQ